MPQSKIQNLKSKIDKALGWVLVVLMGAAVVNVLWQVTSRFGSRFIPGLIPSSFTDELARFLLIWVGLLGASYAAGQRLHLGIDLLPQRLTGRARHGLQLVIEGVIFAFALFVMVVGGWRLVVLQLQLGQTSAALHVPLGYVYLVLPLSGLLMLFYSIVFMLDHVRLLRE